jgi:dimethylhistidine N-methyltransferase
MNSTLEKETKVAYLQKVDIQFKRDVIKGLSSPEKYLQSKYFYDEKGDALFQQIMNCTEYYLTKCELEIFTTQTGEMASTFAHQLKEFDVVELGAGDATKSSFLLKELLDNNIDFTYYPVDISKNIVRLLQKKLPAKFPSIKMHGLNGEYFQMLEKASQLSNKPKAVLFLGSNIGNVPLAQAEEFFTTLRSHLSPGDLVLIGFDLKKDPKLIVDAYNDKAGYTRDFNLNLLQRINNELSADFILENFQHQPTYNAETGSCKSFLTSLRNQTVRVADKTFQFKEGEQIFMEISQKYSVSQTDSMALNSGFMPIKYFYDSRHWFLDAVWECI